jgi:hypothetical protein
MCAFRDSRLRPTAGVERAESEAHLLYFGDLEAIIHRLAIHQ